MSVAVLMLAVQHWEPATLVSATFDDAVLRLCEATISEALEYMAQQQAGLGVEGFSRLQRSERTRWLDAILESLADMCSRLEEDISVH